MRVLLIAIAFLISSKAPSAELELFDRLMERLLQKYDVPGGSLAISKDGRLIYAKGFGYADKAAQIEVTPQSRFRIASISKPIAGVAILTLVERGKLALDDKVYDLIESVALPPGREIHPQTNDVTIRQLLQHTSGQEGQRSSGERSSPMQPPISREIARLYGIPHPPEFRYVIGYMRSLPPISVPGKGHLYSNYGYALLGHVIEKVSGMSFETYVKEHVLAPIEITEMKFGKTRRAERLAGEVTYYDLPGKPPSPSVFVDEDPDAFPYAAWHHEGWGAAGAWIASPSDVVRFVNHVDGRRMPQILSRDSLSEMIARNPITEKRPGFYYGLGWRIQKKKNGEHWYHDGSSSVGAATMMVRAANGLVWCASFNRRMPAGRSLYKEFSKAMWKLTRETKSWPTHDLFN